MIWNFSKFFGIFSKELPSEFVLALDRNYNEVQKRSQYIELVYKQFIDATSGAQSVFLTDGTITEQDQFIIKTDSSVNAVTIYPFTGQTINGAATLALAAQYNKVLLTFKVDRWYIVAT